MPRFHHPYEGLEEIENLPGFIKIGHFHRFYFDLKAFDRSSNRSRDITILKKIQQKTRQNSGILSEWTCLLILKTPVKGALLYCLHFYTIIDRAHFVQNENDEYFTLEPTIITCTINLTFF